MDEGSSKKREDYIGWEDYFMGIAYLSARRSKDPRTQVGACIVDDNNVIISTGYNGMPRGCSDDRMPWGKSEDMSMDKHSFVCHAEMNAILNRNSNPVRDCRIYVTLYPCRNCSKMIIQSGIKEVIYLYSKKNKQEENEVATWLLNQGNIKIRRFIPKRSSINIDFGTENWSPLSHL